MSAAARQVLQDAWNGLGVITSIEPVAEQGINSVNYVVSCRRKGGTFRYLLKTVAPAEADQLERSATVQELCSTHGAPVPPVVRCPDTGDRIVCRNDRAYALFGYCEGMPFQGTVEEATAVATTLARVHRVLRTCVGTFPDPPMYQDLTEAECATIRAALPRRPVDALETLVAQTLPGLPSIYRAVTDALGVHPWPAQVVHLDCGIDNVRFRRRGESALEAVLLDFGHLIDGPRILAVSFAGHRFAGIEPARVQAFLAAYHAIDALEPR